MKRALLVAMGAITLATAAFTPAQAGFVGPKSVVGLDVGDSGSLYIRLSDNPLCGSPIVYVPRSTAYYTDMLAMALTAQTANKPLNVWIENCDANGIGVVVRMVTGTVF